MSPDLKDSVSYTLDSLFLVWIKLLFILFLETLMAVVKVVAETCSRVSLQQILFWFYVCICICVCVSIVIRLLWFDVFLS